MDMLDVQQIFGRAGRPQYDTSGHGIIITSMPNMSKYMGLMTSQVPIESQFLNCIPDNLNAEVRFFMIILQFYYVPLVQI